MPEQLGVLVAHAHPPMLRHLSECVRAKWTVVGECDSIASLKRAIGARRPDFVIVGVDFPDGDGIEAMIEAGSERPMPCVVVSASRSMADVEKAMQDHVMAYLMEPVTAEDVQAAVIVSWTRFEQLRELEEQVGDLRQALADRKLIERAKGIVMATERLSEGEAFARLRSEAQDRRIRLVAVAQDVLDRADRAANNGRA